MNSENNGYDENYGGQKNGYAPRRGYTAARPGVIKRTADAVTVLGGYLKEHHELVLIITALLIICGIVIRLFTQMVFDVYDYKNTEAYRSIGVSESSELRGRILDCNGNELAYSTPAYNLIIDPYALMLIDECSKLSGAELENEKATAQIKAQAMASIISSMFEDVKFDTVFSEIIKRTDKLKHDKQPSGVHYYRAVMHLTENEKNNLINRIKTYNEENKDVKDGKIIENNAFYFEDTQKRIYPYNTVGSLITGYISEYDIPNNGLEAKYDSTLSGVSDRRITGRGTNGIITGVYNTRFEGTDSCDLHSTVDINIQKIVEDAVNRAWEETNADEIRACVVRTTTGEVLAMTNTPGYNANDPSSALSAEETHYIFNTELEKKLKKDEEQSPETDNSAGLTDGAEEADSAEEKKEEKTEEYIQNSTEAISKRTNNNCIVAYDYPGSIYKSFLVAGALEENMEIHYYCGGSYEVENSRDATGNNREITCAFGAAHGWVDEKTLLTNSCNLGAAQLGLDMGEEIFFKYYQAFGFTEATGVDLAGGSNIPGEYLYHSEYSPIDLATCAFGQNNSVSTIQLAMAMSVFGNNGKLMTPYVVSSITDEDGNIVSKTEPTVKRQVISQNTVDRIVGSLEAVVSEGGGSKAGLDHYRIAGKTGTSQIIDAKTQETTGHITSFAGFGPVSSPEITVVINIIDPKDENGSFEEIVAADIAAPVAGEIFEKTLDYLGIQYDK